MAHWWTCTSNHTHDITEVGTVISARPAIEELVPESTVLFNVGGRLFEVLLKTVQKNLKEKTLLQVLLDEYGPEHEGPIFVDANPERFQYILDWYRYGEIHLPAGFPVKALINDVRFFRLPKSVKVNGASLEVPCEADVREEAVSTITENWDNFTEYVNWVIEQVQRKLSDLASHAKTEQDDVHTCLDTPFKMEIDLSEPKADGCSHKWKHPKNVCSRERLKVLVSELKKRGFACEVSPVQKKSGQWNPMKLKVGFAEGKWENDSEGSVCERLGKAKAEKLCCM